MKRPGRMLLIGAWASAMFSAEPALPVDHRPTPYNADRIERMLKPAILPIYLGNVYEGTGFVVAAESGYILTAAHVVEDRGDSKAPISVALRADNEPRIRLTASIVGSLASNDGPDLALIQVTPTDALKKLRSIGVSFAPLARSEQFFAVGYPADESDTPIWRIDQVNCSGDYGRLISVTQPVEGGNSGSPLLDARGCARGVCVQLRGAGRMTASYVRIEEARPLLDKLPLSGEMSEIDRRIRNREISGSDLDELLMGDPPHPSNSELYAWGRAITAHAHDYRAFGDLFYYTIFPALDERGLPQIVWEIAGALGPLNRPVTKGIGYGFSWAREQMAKAELSRARGQMAEAEFAAGRVLQALQYAKEALTLAQEGKDHQGELSSRILLGRIQLVAGNVGNARAQVDYVLKWQDLSDAMNARVFALSGAVADKAGDFKQAGESYDKAARFFVAASDYWQAAAIRSAIANMDLRAGKLDEAESGLHQAAEFYRKVSYIPGESETLYQLAQIQTATGSRERLVQTLKSYLSVEPKGAHATEVESVLASLSSDSLNPDNAFDRMKGSPPGISTDSLK